MRERDQIVRASLVAALVALLVSACAAEPAAESTEVDTDGGGDVIDLEPPEVAVPEGDPPSELETDDLVPGDGEVVDGDELVTVHLVGIAWSTGEVVVSTWERGPARTFALGRTVPGFREGLVGMRVGGRRQIIVPPELGYAEGAPAGVDPDETLVLVVDLMDAE